MDSSHWWPMLRVCIDCGLSERLSTENSKLRSSLQEMIDMVPQNYEYRKNSADRAQVVLDRQGEGE